jgi:hypothetical protein
MTFVAMACNYLLGYTEERATRSTLLVLPSILAIPFLLIADIDAIPFLLIADIDSPHGGLIRVVPQNLILLAHSLSPP